MPAQDKKELLMKLVRTAVKALQLKKEEKK